MTKTMRHGQKQDERIRAILGEDEGKDFKDFVRTFFEHLRAHLQLPAEVTGMEDFRWEEPYVFGDRPRRDYARLRKIRPSFRDRYLLLDIEMDVISEWMLYAGEDISAHVRRIGDGMEFHLGLSELKATDKKSSAYQQLDDYAVWFANARFSQ